MQQSCVTSAASGTNAAGTSGKVWTQVARDGYHKAEKPEAASKPTVAKPKPVKAPAKDAGWDEDIPF